MSPQKKTSEKIKNTLKGIFTFPISPRRQFRRLMVLFFVLLVALVAFQVQFFNKVKSETVFEAATAPTTPAKTVNEKRLTLVLSRYEDKAKTREAALKASPAVSSPGK